MKESAFKTFIRGSTVSLTGTLILGLMNYVIRRFLCIELLPADYGMFYSTLALLSMIYAFSDLGLSQSATALIAQYSGSEKQYTIFNAFFYFRLGLAGLTTCAVYLLADFLCRHYLKSSDSAPFYWLGALFFFQVLSGCFNSLYNGLKRFETLQIFQVSGTAILLLGVLLFGKDLLSSCIVFAVEAFLLFAGNIIYSFHCKKVQFQRKTTPEDWRNLLKIGGSLAISTTLFSSLYYMDTVMLTSLRGVESAALYNVAMPLMQIMQAGMVFPTVMLPIAMDMNREKKYSELKHFAMYAFFITLAAAPCCYLFFVWSGQWLICALFASKYADAAPAVPLLCTALLFLTSGHFLSQLLISFNQLRTVVLIAVICFVSNILLNYVLILNMDFTGAAIATLCSYFIFMIMSFFILIYKIKQKMSGKEQ